MSRNANSGSMVIRSASFKFLHIFLSTQGNTEITKIFPISVVLENINFINDDRKSLRTMNDYDPNKICGLKVLS
ncbi:MAG: hypothetical protein ACK56F_12815, partial [bacterium]